MVVPHRHTNTKILFVLLLLGLLTVFAGCAQDPYKDYVSSGLHVRQMDFDYDDMDNFTFGYDKAELFADYKDYSQYNFDFPYTESYFEQNDLLVFVVRGCSSDGMEFGEVLQDSGKLYPLFYRNKRNDGDPVTDDIIVLSYCAEVPKNQGYRMGEIIYRYR